TLGSASVVCSDKTGTLTKGEMTIGRVVTASGEVVVTGVGYRPDGTVERDGAPLTEGEPLWRGGAVGPGGGRPAGDATRRPAAAWRATRPCASRTANGSCRATRPRARSSSPR